MTLLADRFESTAHDGPVAYAHFLATTGDAEESARYRQEAVAVVGQFLDAFQAALSS